MAFRGQLPSRISQKAAARAWLSSLSSEYTLALTLTLKQVRAYSTPLGKREQAIDRTHAERIAKRFIQKLNRAVFGKRLETGRLQICGKNSRRAISFALVRVVEVFQRPVREPHPNHLGMAA